MATRAKLDGRPLQRARQIEQMYRKPRDTSESRRSWGRRLGNMVNELAIQSNVEPGNFAEHVPARIVAAIARERALARLTARGVVPVAQAAEVTLVTQLARRNRRGRQPPVAA